MYAMHWRACKKSLLWLRSTKLHLHENLTQTETLPEFLLAGFGETTSRGCQALSQKVPLWGTWLLTPSTGCTTNFPPSALSKPPQLSTCAWKQHTTLKKQKRNYNGTFIIRLTELKEKTPWMYNRDQRHMEGVRVRKDNKKNGVIIISKLKQLLTKESPFCGIATLDYGCWSNCLPLWFLVFRL